MATKRGNKGAKFGWLFKADTGESATKTYSRAFFISMCAFMVIQSFTWEHQTKPLYAKEWIKFNKQKWKIRKNRTKKNIWWSCKIAKKNCMCVEEIVEPFDGFGFGMNGLGTWEIAEQGVYQVGTWFWRDFRKKRSKPANPNLSSGENKQWCQFVWVASCVCVTVAQPTTGPWRWQPCPAAWKGTVPPRPLTAAIFVK